MTMWLLASVVLSRWPSMVDVDAVVTVMTSMAMAVVPSRVKLGPSRR